MASRGGSTSEVFWNSRASFWTGIIVASDQVGLGAHERVAARSHGKGFVAKLDGVADLTQAELLRGVMIGVLREDLRIRKKVNTTGKTCWGL